MELKGKLVCGIIGIFIGDLLGLPLGGLVGFILGSLAGHYYFDQPKEEAADDTGYKDYQRRQGAFLFHVFTLCAKMAKIDSPINHAEVSFMEKLIRNQFRLNDQGRMQVIRIWNKSKESDESFDQFAQAFYQDFAQQRYQVLNMMDLLFAMAAADGGLHRREEELLLRASGIFHISRMHYDRIKSRYYHVPNAKTASWNPMDPYYAILGAQPHEPLDIIKKKFRELAMQWHPDRMSAKGATPEAMRHAKEKFQQINEAYEKIVESKK